MNEIARRPLPRMTTEAFLAWPGDGSGRKFVLVEGEVHALAPASNVHGVVQMNLGALVHAAILAGGHDLYLCGEGAVRPGLLADGTVRVPNLVAGPAIAQRGQVDVPSPVLLVEILSPGNERQTRQALIEYREICSAREIVLVHIERVGAEILRRGPDAAWGEVCVIEPGGMLRLDTIGLECPIEAPYRGTWLQAEPDQPRD